jgi:hypothetical protein
MRERANAVTGVERLLNEVHPRPARRAEYCYIHGVP